MVHTDIYSEEYSILRDKHFELKRQLRELRKEFRTCERNEREAFEQLFIYMRECNRKEGYLAEQSKYWSIIASVVSAILASVFTSLNNWWRFNELREMTEEVAHKEIKISSDDLNQIEVIVKEATENVLEKMVDKNSSLGISK
ncbi:unnamed protein product [Meganyctiphanes norvegica]|uniref:SMODS and SLOG-associating 2TM effector domain-containing protein n=1 Tax=Meganyctiphanes norvegica TaxID=48144 RepID=A0AAV2QYN9_MEGNR